MANDTPMSGIGNTSGSDMGTGSRSASGDICPTCGHSPDAQNKGLEQFLGRIGLSEDVIEQLKSSMQNVDVEQYLNSARDYISSGGKKAGTYAKDHPGRVAAGVAVLAVGAGLLINAMKE